MINLILNILHKSKALDIVIFDRKNNFIYTDYIIVSTGTSTTHLNSVSKNLNTYIKNNFKNNIMNISGLNTDWIIIDLNNIVINIMLKNTRILYNLESFLNEKENIQ